MIDSPRRCRNDGKRMVLDAGQHESEGDVEIVHTCLHCGRTEKQRPERDLVSDGPSLASLRDRIRAGYQRPMTPPAAFEAILEEAQ